MAPLPFGAIGIPKTGHVGKWVQDTQSHDDMGHGKTFRRKVIAWMTQWGGIQTDKKSHPKAMVIQLIQRDSMRCQTYGCSPLCMLATLLHILGKQIG